MWNSINTPCLQNMSNAIVNATYQWITPNQSIPSWIYNLPEPERSEKIGIHSIDYTLRFYWRFHGFFVVPSSRRHYKEAMESPIESVICNVAY
jgi:hypothetical protein